MAEIECKSFGTCHVAISPTVAGLGVALIPDVLGFREVVDNLAHEELLDLGDMRAWLESLGYALDLEGGEVRTAGAHVWAVVRSEENTWTEADFVIDGATEADLKHWQRGQQARDHAAELLEQCSLERSLLARLA